MAYKGNPSLRDHCEIVPINESEISELIKCSEDIIYFAEKYFYITDIDAGNIVIPLREYQKRMLKSFVDSENEVRKNRVVLSARQIGKCVTGDTKIKIINKNKVNRQPLLIKILKYTIKKLLTINTNK